MRPPADVRAFARQLMETTEVDILFGNSAHVAQGVEVHNGRLIIYQAGDFLDDYATDQAWRNDWGASFTARFRLPAASETPATPGALRRARPQLESVEVVPLQLSFARTCVSPPGARTTRAMAARLQKLCAELGTNFDVDAHTGVLRWQGRTASV